MAKRLRDVCALSESEPLWQAGRGFVVRDLPWPSSLLDTRVVYCGDNLEQLAKLPDACVDLIYIDPPFNSNRNYEWASPARTFWARPRSSAPLPTATNPPVASCSRRPQAKETLRR
jgi:hypothetical protein